MPYAVRSRSQQLRLSFGDAPLWSETGLEAPCRVSRATGRPDGHREPVGAAVVPPSRRRGEAATAPDVPSRIPLVAKALARSLRRRSRGADSEVRRFMNENLHRVRKVPRRCRRFRPRGAATTCQVIYDRLNRQFFDGGSRCRSPGAAAEGAPGAERSPSAATIRCWPDPHPPAAGPRRRAALLPGERRLS